jgi:hypothetical protein
VKSLNDNRFFSLLARLQAESNPNPMLDQWMIEGISWQRERHSHWGRDYAFQMECQTLTSDKPHAWRLLVVTEKWWDAKRDAPARLSQWSKLTAGDRKKVLDWFRHQEKRLDAEA